VSRSRVTNRWVAAYILTERADRLATGWDVIDFSELYRTHAGDVHRFVLFLSGDPALEDDILSETFIRLWSPDGKLLFYDEAHPDSGLDIWRLPLGGEPEPVLVSPAREEYPTVSPNGQWLAYHSNEFGGRVEVYVRPLPCTREDIRSQPLEVTRQCGLEMAASCFTWTAPR
jgi:hypothetical protein